MAIIFEPISRRIILDVTTISATELYSRSVDWLAQSDNLKYGEVFRQVGSDDLGSGLYIPPYYFLQNTWRIRPMEASHLLTITGNLFVDGGGVPVVSTLGNYNVSIQYTVPVQAQAFSTTGSTGPTPDEIASAVWDKLLAEHTINGSAGKALSTASSGGVDYGTLADAVWNSNILDISAEGSAAAVLKDTSATVNTMLDIQAGTWEIKNNQMLFYSLSGDLISTYNLFDRDGKPSMSEVFKRELV